MSIPDEHRSRRAITALSHGKPRPYRRQAISDEPFRLSRVQIALLSVGALMIAGLILSVAVIAQEHANATRGKAIIAADASASAEPAKLVRRAVKADNIRLPQMPTPPVLDDSSLPFPLPMTPPVQAGTAARAPATAIPPRLFLPRVQTPARQTERPVAPPEGRLARRTVARAPVRVAQADPDVDLIATILELTPPASPDRATPVCNASEVLENLCPQHHGMR